MQLTPSGHPDADKEDKWVLFFKFFMGSIFVCICMPISWMAFYGLRKELENP